MKKKEKQMIAILIVVTIIIIAIVYFVTRSNKTNNGKNNNQLEDSNKVVEEYVQLLDDGTKLNTSTKLNETKNVNGLSIGNIQLTMNGGETTLLADVTNNTGRDLGITAIDIVLLDKEEKEIVTIGGMIGNVKNSESVKLQAGTTLDFANAYDFKVVVK